jgi:PhnB protein
MLVKVRPYLFFEGRAEEAIGFYRDAIGAEVTEQMRYRDSPDPLPPGMVPPGSEDRIMHATLRLGGQEIMASDGRCSGDPRFAGISVSLMVPDAAQADRLFAALAEGGQVLMPIGPTFFSTHFGVLHDRFGVSWMIGVEEDA